MVKKSKQNKERNSKIIGVIISLTVISLLIASGPANALTLSLGDFSDSNPVKGNEISLLAGINLLDNERISFNNALGVFIDDVLVCGFSINENGSCSDYGINAGLLIKNTSYGYGYGYMYGYDYSYGYNQGYSNGKFTYNITINTSKYSIGEHKVILRVNTKTDEDKIIFESNEKTFNVNVKEGQEYANESEVTVGNNADEVVIDSGSGNVSKIVIPSNVSQDKEIKLDMSALMSNGNVTLSENLTLTREGTNNYSATLMKGTTVIGGSGWDGKITLPTVKNNSAFSASGSIDLVIDLGSSAEINFSKPVKIILGGMSGKKAAWSRNSVLNDISLVCDNIDSPTNIDSNINRECYGNSGSDLIIWTYHFTNFGAYTPLTVSTGIYGGGNDGPIINRATQNTTLSSSNNNQNNAKPIVQTTNNQNANVNSSIQTPRAGGITGAVIGGGVVSWTAAIIVLVLIVGTTIVLRNRRKRNSNIAPYYR